MNFQNYDAYLNHYNEFFIEQMGGDSNTITSPYVKKPDHMIEEDLRRGQETAAQGGLERVKEKVQSDEYQEKKIAAEKGNRAAKKSYNRLVKRGRIAKGKLKRAQENADYIEARAAVPTKKDSGCIIS